MRISEDYQYNKIYKNVSVNLPWETKFVKCLISMPYGTNLCQSCAASLCLYWSQFSLMGVNTWAWFASVYVCCSSNEPSCTKRCSDSSVTVVVSGFLIMQRLWRVLQFTEYTIIQSFKEVRLGPTGRRAWPTKDDNVISLSTFLALGFSGMLTPISWDSSLVWNRSNGQEKALVEMHYLQSWHGYRYHNVNVSFNEKGKSRL